MPLVLAKCPNCGATLQVDNTKDAAICQHCSSAYVVEKAINHYTVTNHIVAESVNVFNQKEDFSIRAGTLEKYKGAAPDVTIPEGVRIIGNGAFRDCFGMTAVKIGEGVTEILAGAFANCHNLEKVQLPNTLRRLEAPFEGCRSLHELVIPPAVQYVALPQTTGLKKVTLPEGLTFLPAHAFYHCDNLEEITLPRSVESVGESAFEWCTKLRKLTILGKGTRFFIDADAIPFFRCSNLTEIIAADTGMLKSQERAFDGSAWYYRRMKRCDCGGYFEGLLRPKCNLCGKPKKNNI